MSEKKTSWGRWGTDDERGALNLLTPEVVTAALGVPTTGKAYALSIPIQRTGVPNLPFRGIPQRLTLTNHDDEQMSISNGGVPGVGSSEDMLVMASHTSTHMDALCHVYADNKLYNGFPHDQVAPYSGAQRCGIDKVGAIAGRGVLIDVASALGVDVLEPGHMISRTELTDTLRHQGTALEPGDLVLIRTGWVGAFMDERVAIHPQPGIGLDAAAYLVEQDVAIVGADNSAVEALPFEGGVYLGCHIMLLVDNGIHLIENMALDELAQDNCHEFLLTVGALKVTGATGSPVTPIAIG